MRPIDLILIAAETLLQAGVVALLVRRRLYRRFLFFLIYTLYSIVVTVVRVVLAGGSPQVYFYVYYSTDLLYGILGLAAIYESFRSIFLPFYHARWFRGLSWLLVLTPLATVAWKLVQQPPLQVSRLGVAILSLEIGMRYVQASLFLLTFLLLRFLRLTVSRYESGIVDGLGIAAIGALLGNILRSQFGTRFENFFHWSPTVSYLIAILIWLSSLWGEEDSGNDRRTPPQTPEQMLEELRRSTELAKKILRLRWKIRDTGPGTVPSRTGGYAGGDAASVPLSSAKSERREGRRAPVSG